jgi:hypothetical protein
MDNISSAIGALELGDHFEGHGDGALETAVLANPPRTYMPCTVGPAFCANDDALLRAAETAMSPPHTGGGCTILRGACITDDGALEAAGTAIGPSPTIYAGCPTLICR